MEDALRYAVLIPCLEDFRAVLPEADIYVFDNNCTDRTAEIAREAGALVERETRQGKGNVVRAMFEKIEADVHVLVDGDDTYPAEALPSLLEPVAGGEADMVVGCRTEQAARRSIKPVNRLGNRWIGWLFNACFRTKFRDLLSGYRVMTRDFVKNVPVITGGFDVETGLAIQSVVNGYVVKEVPIPYRERPAGSVTKLRPLADGCRIVKTMLGAVIDFRPMWLFTLVTALLLAVAVGFGISALLVESASSALFLTIFLCFFMLLAALSASLGIVLKVINIKHLEHMSVWRKRAGPPNTREARTRRRSRDA